MLKDDKIRIQHILDAAGEAVNFTKDRSRTDLDTDRQLNLSLVRLLEVIGEAARGISPKFQDEYPQLPWRSMAGMRNRLIHGYFDINLDVVWRTVTEDLPSLINQLKNLDDKK